MSDGELWTAEDSNDVPQDGKTQVPPPPSRVPLFPATSALTLFTSDLSEEAAAGEPYLCQAENQTLSFGLFHFSSFFALGYQVPSQMFEAPSTMRPRAPPGGRSSALRR